ncbi:MAG: DUF1003 domain-containing protein [Brevundimonas sp.]|nr:DUF1003 domain-containing protein [Brevundimonas sp.]
MPFVLLHLLLFGGWIVLNTAGPPAWRFDPSLVVLAMTASVEAIFLSTFILISQNRISTAERRRAELDLQINLLAEHEVTRLIDLVTRIGRPPRRFRPATPTSTNCAATSRRGMSSTTLSDAGDEGGPPPEKTMTDVSGPRSHHARRRDSPAPEEMEMRNHRHGRSPGRGRCGSGWRVAASCASNLTPWAGPDLDDLPHRARRHGP